MLVVLRISFHWDDIAGDAGNFEAILGRGELFGFGFGRTRPIFRSSLGLVCGIHYAIVPVKKAGFDETRTTAAVQPTACVGCSKTPTNIDIMVGVVGIWRNGYGNFDSGPIVFAPAIRRTGFLGKKGKREVLDVIAHGQRSAYGLAANGTGAFLIEGMPQRCIALCLTAYGAGLTGGTGGGQPLVPQRLAVGSPANRACLRLGAGGVLPAVAERASGSLASFGAGRGGGAGGIQPLMLTATAGERQEQRQSKDKR